MSDNVFDEALEDFDDELEDFDDEDNYGSENVSAPAASGGSVFNAVEETEQQVQTQARYDTQTVQVKEKTSGESVFAPIDEKELDKKIMERNKVWREATLSGENDNGVECALAHGLPDWDLMPPEMLVRRRSVK